MECGTALEPVWPSVSIYESRKVDSNSTGVWRFWGYRVWVGSGGEHPTARIPHYGAWKPLAEGRVGTRRPCDGDNRILPSISFSPSFSDNLLPWSLNTFCYLIANCVFILYGSFPLSALLHSFWLLRSLSLSPDLVLFSSFFLQVQCQAAKREEQESLKEAWSWKLSTFPSTWGSRLRRLAIEIAKWHPDMKTLETCCRKFLVRHWKPLDGRGSKTQNVP